VNKANKLIGIFSGTIRTTFNMITRKRLHEKSDFKRVSKC